MQKNLDIKIFKKLILDNVSLNKDLMLTLLNFLTLSVSLNQFSKLIVFVKSQNRSIFIYITDPSLLHFYRELLSYLKKDLKTEHIQLGTKKDLFHSLKQENHNIGMVFYLGFSLAQPDFGLQKYIFQKDVFFISGFFHDKQTTTDLFYNFSFPIKKNTIYNHLLFLTFLLFI